MKEMDPITWPFIEPMEFTDYQQHDMNAIISTPAVSGGVEEDLSQALTLPPKLHLQQCLDRLFDSISVTAPSGFSTSSIKKQWNDCTFASEYLAILQQVVIPQLQNCHIGQQLFANYLQQEIITATTQCHRHHVYIDQETVRENLSLSERRKYQRDAARYDKAKTMMQLQLQHQHNIVEVRREMVILARELERLLLLLLNSDVDSDVVQVIVQQDTHSEYGRTYIEDMDSSWGLQMIHRDEPTDQARIAFGASVRAMRTAIHETEVCGRAIGRMIDSLLETEVREHLQVRLKQEGWTKQLMTTSR